MIHESTQPSDRHERNRRMMLEGKKLFVAEFDKHLKGMKTALDAVRQNLDSKAAHDLYRIAHTLKGSAPIFGFGLVGTAAEELVHLWEWMEDKKETAVDIPFPGNLLELSEKLLLRLQMEYEICLKELELEDKELDGESVSPPLLGRLLIVDDDPALRSFLKRRLEMEGYQVEEAGDVETAKSRLWERKFDLILLDLMMHPTTGYTLFDFLKDDPTCKWIPLIVLSGRNELKDKIRCFQLGADDYVTKPFAYEELEARIRSLLLRTKHYEQMASVDPLTGVYNRRFFDKQLPIEVNRATRLNVPISLAFLDIDRFKRINDNYGHHFGDVVLQGLTHLLQQQIRSTDLLARYGGEEFVLVFPQSTEAQAVQILSKIQEKLLHEPVVQMDGQEFFITFSAGVAEWNSQLTIETWLQLADDAMYQAKQQGRNRIATSQGAVSTDPAEKKAAKKRVLLVDDDDIIRSILRSRLSHLPIEMMEAKDGEQALEILKSQQVDACILDGIMPKLDGYGLLEEMKRHPVWKKIKVLMLSGRKKEDDVVRGLLLGADDYMSKPFSLIELEIRVKRLLTLE